MAIEADELRATAALLPPPDALLALARRRLDDELRALPSPFTPAGLRALLADDGANCSFGALAHAIRAVAHAGRMAEARDLFVALLRRIDGLNRRWVAATLRSLPLTAEERHERAQDLAQELILYLWEQLTRRDDPAWELFFQRALDFAQSHVATIYLRRQGLRADPRARRPERGLAIVFSRLSPEAGADSADSADSGAPSALATAIMSTDAFTRAELADLRALVARLPPRERLTVVMRFWQQATEAEIALALGGVSARAVRYTLTRAYTRLRAWYAGDDATIGATTQESEEAHDDNPAR